MKFRKIACCAMTGVMLMSTNQFVFTTNAGSYAIASVSMTVGLDNSCDFNSVQKAIDSVTAIPTAEHPVNIYIQPGVYNEVVKVTKPYIRLINSSGNAEKVVITYDRASGHSDSTRNFGTEKSATFSVEPEATGFRAENITFVNSYNIDDTTRTQTQAVAVMTQADKIVFENCRFIGRQDTLYLKGASMGQNVYGQANPARVYLKDCYVEGTVDFIFGDATAFFDNCRLFMAYYEKGGHFTAANTTLFNLGYVFNGCELSVSDKYTAENANMIDLGRPWQADLSYKNYGSATTFINCKLPEILKPEGFSLWDSLTVENKIRYKEYGSRDKNGKLFDLSKRAGFVQILTEEQAQAYNAYNVLKGTDGWNPANADRGNSVAADITINEYVVSVPQEEEYTLVPVVMPEQGSVKFYSENPDIATISSNGVIKGVKQGKTRVFAENENGVSVYGIVSVTAPRTDIPKLDKVEIKHKDNIKVGDVISVSYSYALDSDNKLDQAVITWYALKNDEVILLQSGVGEYYKNYTVANADLGYRFKAVVEPATVTTYGETGEGVSAETQVAVNGGNNTSETYVREGFEDKFEVQTSGKWDKLEFGDNQLVGICDKGEMFLTDTKEWGDTTFNGKFRFNPESNGWSADDSFDLYMNYTDKNSDYYRLNVVRGSNTKSLKLYIYKNTGGQEILLAKDETTLKNNVYQNSGDMNPYFFINMKKSKENIEVTFRFEGETANKLKLTAKDNEPLSKGYALISISGKPMTLLVDRISVEKTYHKENESAVKVFLAGDSTVKDYGDSNNIGGWGEFIVNYFTDEVQVVNKAEGGRSIRSYLNQGRLDEIISEGKKGDYVFIQFGHNDARTDENAYIEHSVVLGEPDENGIYPTISGVKTATPQRIIDFYATDAYPYKDTFYSYDTGSFKWYYKQYIDKIRKADMIPVVITPVCRVFFDAEGKITPHFGEDNGYVEAVKQVAAETGCNIVDMYEITKELYESYGVMTTQTLHHVKEDGTMDLTHYNKFGANLIASKMSQALSQQNIAIAKDTKNSTVAVSKVEDLKSANLFVLGNGGKGNAQAYKVDTESFGAKIGDYFVNKITTYDLTAPDAGARTYLNTEEYATFKQQLKEGDYVMLCFGKNEGNKLSKDYLDENQFKSFVFDNYVKPVMDAKAIPIIITPYVNAKFSQGEVMDTVGAYDDKLKEIVVENGLYFVDITAQSTQLYNTMGVDGSKVLNPISQKGIDRNSLSEFGAYTVAKAIVSSMKYSSATLKNYIDDTMLNKNDILTKGEFVTYLMRVIEKTGKPDTNFNDVPYGKSYTDAVGMAKQYNIAVADENGNFNPESAITADEMKKMLENALAFSNKANVDLSNVYELITGDAVSNEIGLWAIDKLYEAVR